MCAKNTLTTVLTALKVLEILESEDGIGPTELADRLGVTRPAAYNYLSTLTEAGYARNQAGQYHISYRVLGLGNRLKYRNQFFRAARTPLRKLISDIDDPAFIGIEESGKWTLLHRDGDITSIDVQTYPGLRLPLHTHSAGKVCLAEMEPDRRNSIIESVGLGAKTKETITDRKDLETELDQIRDQGYAYGWNEHAHGVGSAARPIFVNGEFIGTISIASVTANLQKQQSREIILQRLKEVAEEIIINYRHM